MTNDPIEMRLETCEVMTKMVLKIASNNETFIKKLKTYIEGRPDGTKTLFEKTLDAYEATVERALKIALTNELDLKKLKTRMDYQEGRTSIMAAKIEGLNN